MEPGKTSGNITFTPICNSEQQESQEEEIINLGESQEYEVESAFSEYATFEIHDPAPTAHLEAPKRKKGKSAPSYQAEMISLEKRKLEWLNKQGEGKWRGSEFLQVPSSVYETTPSHKKVILEVTFPKHGGRWD